MQLIARALEKVMTGICVRLVDLTVQVHDSPGALRPPALMFRLDELEFTDQPGAFSRHSRVRRRRCKLEHISLTPCVESAWFQLIGFN